MAGAEARARSRLTPLSDHEFGAVSGKPGPMIHMPWASLIHELPETLRVVRLVEVTDLVPDHSLHHIFGGKHEPPREAHSSTRGA